MPLPKFSQTLFFWISRAFFLFGLPLFISDLPGYLEATNRFLLGHEMPYRDFPLEYPPLAFFLLVLARKAAFLLGLNSTLGLKSALAFFLLPLDWALFRKFRFLSTNIAASYLVLTCLLAPLLYDRLDLALAACLALPLFPEGKKRFALWWGLGGALKIVPALLLPLAAVQQKKWKPLLLGLIPLLLSALLVFVLSTQSDSFWAIQGSRGLQIESLPASLLFLLEKWQWLGPIATDSLFGAQEISGFVAFTVAWKIFYAAIAALTLGRLSFEIRSQRITLAGAAWVLLLTLVAWSFVLSPQFVLWLLPLSLLVQREVPESRQKAFHALLYFAVLATSVHFLFYWSYAEDRSPASIALTCARNLGLLLWLGLGWRWLRKAPAQG